MNLKLSCTIGESERDEFIRWASDASKRINPYKLDYHDLSKYPSELIAEGVRILDGNRGDITKALSRLSDPKDPHLLVEVPNLPLDDLIYIPSPPDGFVPQEKTTFVTELAYMALAQIMKTRIRVGTREEKHPFNLPFHQVVPQVGYEYEGSNRGAGDFPLHQDRIFVPDTPDFLVLCGLREEQDVKVKTHFYPITKLLEGMPDGLIEELRKKQFTDPKNKISEPIALLQGDYNSPTFVSRLDLEKGWIKGMTSEAKKALDHLQQREVQRSVLPGLESIILKPGVVVISDHHRLLHARDAFETHSEIEHRRWVLRSHFLKINSKNYSP